MALCAVSGFKVQGVCVGGGGALGDQIWPIVIVIVLVLILLLLLVVVIVVVVVVVYVIGWQAVVFGINSASCRRLKGVK